MDNEITTQKKRGWIKNVAIIFLLVLLLLTFFSNTILTYSLPEVSAQYGEYTSLSSSVKLSGTVKANESYKVVYEPTGKDAVVQTRKVKSVYVREGDYVEKDQPILIVEGGMSDELKSLKEQYDSLKKAYDLALSGDNVSYLQNSQTLERVQSAYDEAKKALDEIQAKYDALMKGVESESDKLAKSEEIKVKRKTLEADIKALEEKLAEVQTKIEIAKGSAGDNPDANITKEELRFAEIEGNYNELKNRESKMSAELSNLRKSIDGMRQANVLTATISELTIANEKLIEANSRLIASNPILAEVSDELLEQLKANNELIEANKLKIDEAERKLKIIGQKQVSDIELFEAEYNLGEYEEEYSAVAAELADYAPTYESAKANIELFRKQYAANEELTELRALLETYEAQLDAAKKEYDGTVDIAELQLSLREATAAVKSAKNDLDITKAQLNQSNQSTGSDRAEQKKQLDELLDKIQQYENAPETLDVKAPISGRIVSIYVVPGESVSSGVTVADIEIADKGYTCEVTVSTEEARKIQVGSPVTVSNSWWYSNIEASIIQIRSDVQSQGKNKIVIFEIKGDAYEGQQLSFSVGDRSSTYDSVFPNSAIRQDSEGTYVLTVESKKTPLGIRYKAHRVKVDIVASDDTKTAVSGLLGGEFVITNSEKPVSDGQMIRLADK